MMLCRERASVEEGRVEGGRVDEGNKRGREHARKGRNEAWTARGKEGREEACG